MRARLVANISLALVSVAATLGIAELAVRWTGIAVAERSRVAPEPAWNAPDQAGRGYSRLVLHPYLGWSERSDSSMIPELLALPKQDYVVIVFGGSVAELLGRLATPYLEARLAELRPELRGRLRVLALGHGGYKQPQQLFFLTQLLLLGAPLDLVIELDGYNEIALARVNGKKGVHPILPSEDHYPAVRDLAGGLKDRDSILEAAHALELTQRSLRLESWLHAGQGLARSQLLQLLLGRVASSWEGEARQLQIDWNERASKGMSDAVADLPQDCLGEQHDCLELQADIWLRSSLAMGALARAHGLAYAQVLQPNQYIPGSKVLTQEELRVAYRPELDRMKAMAPGYELLRERARVLEAHGFVFRDASMIFARVPETLYTDFCCHFNKRGNEILADAIAEAAAQAIAREAGRPESAEP